MTNSCDTQPWAEPQPEFFFPAELQLPFCSTYHCSVPTHLSSVIFWQLPLHTLLNQKQPYFSIVLKILLKYIFTSENDKYKQNLDEYLHTTIPAEKNQNGLDTTTRRYFTIWLILRLFLLIKLHKYLEETQWSRNASNIAGKKEINSVERYEKLP